MDKNKRPAWIKEAADRAEAGVKGKTPDLSQVRTAADRAEASSREKRGESTLSQPHQQETISDKQTTDVPTETQAGLEQIIASTEQSTSQKLTTLLNSLVFGRGGPDIIDPRYQVDEIREELSKLRNLPQFKGAPEVLFSSMSFSKDRNRNPDTLYIGMFLETAFKKIDLLLSHEANMSAYEFAKTLNAWIQTIDPNAEATFTPAGGLTLILKS